jgi:hypothetical protein
MATFRCTVSGIFPSGLSWSFRQHFESSATTSQISTDWSAAVTGWWSDATNGMALSYPTGTELGLTTVAMLNGVPYRETEKLEVTHTLAGTLTADSLPENVCVVASLRAAQVGARNRGRLHFPAPAEDQAVGGSLVGATAIRMNNATDNLFASMRSAGHTPIVYNAKVSKVPTVDPVIQTGKVIVTQQIDKNLRTQRRRTKKRRADYV